MLGMLDAAAAQIGMVGVSAPVQTTASDPVRRAVQLARQQRLQRLRLARPRLRDRHDHRQLRGRRRTRSGVALPSTRRDRRRHPRASRPAATLPTAKRFPPGAGQTERDRRATLRLHRLPQRQQGQHRPRLRARYHLPQGNYDDQQPCRTAVDLANSYNKQGVTIYSIGYALGNNVNCTRARSARRSIQGNSVACTRDGRLLPLHQPHRRVPPSPPTTRSRRSPRPATSTTSRTPPSSTPSSRPSRPTSGEARPAGRRRV